MWKSCLALGMGAALAACASGSADDYVEDGDRGFPVIQASNAPQDFTGCVAEDGRCFVTGREVDTALRFEPQSGRFWFLDPVSGNTFFSNGELRTGDPFRERRALEMVSDEGREINRDRYGPLPEGGIAPIEPFGESDDEVLQEPGEERED